MTKGNLLVRIFVAIALATLLVPISWSLARLVTPGFFVADKVLEAQPPSLGGISISIEIAAVVDFAIWLAAVWGAQDLWRSLREELEGRESAIRSNRRRDPAILLGATLAALPFSIYFMLGFALFSSGRLPEWKLASLGATGMCLFAFSVVVQVLFALAVKFWPKPML